MSELVVELVHLYYKVVNEIIRVLYFLCYEVFALKNLFSFLPFYLFALSHFGLNWCIAVGG